MADDPPSNKLLERLFLANLARVERAIAFVCRRHGLTGADAEDFGSWVKVRIIEDNYRILREFKGGSSMPTYLAVVIQNLGRDYCNQQWGRWRPSAKAERRGEVAVTLERLVVRDGHTLAEAMAILRSRFGFEQSDAELEALAAQLPLRPKRQFEGEEVLASLPSNQEADRGLLKRESRELVERLREALDRALAKLDPEDRLMVQLEREQGLSVAQIARALGVEQMPLYHRRRKALRFLGEELTRGGFNLRQALEALEWLADELEGDEETSPSEDPPPGPSKS
ncbi:MAG TPA: sigma-70 family RNA polymerase sigma factor [Thermoanaerobaculia bacterium]|nr:sigma-70 family RNA polymerase sigma factor [Thermoanaerobaculia bacterium]